VASLVELPVNNDERLSAMCELSGLYFVSREHLTEEVIEIRCPLVDQKVGLCHRIFVKLHDLEVGRSHRSVSPRA
jgi:hypothetical protein